MKTLIIAAIAASIAAPVLAMPLGNTAYTPAQQAQLHFAADQDGADQNVSDYIFERNASAIGGTEVRLKLANDNEVGYDRVSVSSRDGGSAAFAKAHLANENGSDE